MHPFFVEHTAIPTRLHSEGQLSCRPLPETTFGPHRLLAIASGCVTGAGLAEPAPTVYTRLRKAASAAPSLHRAAEYIEHGERVVPADAGIGDALAIGELGGVVLAGVELLCTRLDVAFHHHAEDSA